MSKNVSPSLSISPQASATESSSSTLGEVRVKALAKDEVGREVVAVGGMMALRVVEMEAEVGVLDRAAVVGGTEDERVSDASDEEVPLGLVCMSPLAAVILLVNEEIAQPVQEAESLAEVPIRGVLLFGVVLDGGNAVSGNVAAYLRMRDSRTSKVFSA